MYLETIQPELKSSLNITTGATVYFVNLTFIICRNAGGAVFGLNAMMHIGAKARVVFMNNTADNSGGAVHMKDGMITVGAESCVIFTYNHATDGGAIGLFSGTLIVDNEAILIFSHNSADSGGAHWLFGLILVTHPLLLLRCWTFWGQSLGLLSIPKATKYYRLTLELFRYAIKYMIYVHCLN